ITVFGKPAPASLKTQLLSLFCAPPPDPHKAQLLSLFCAPPPKPSQNSAFITVLRTQAQVPAKLSFYQCFAHPRPGPRKTQLLSMFWLLRCLVLESMINYQRQSIAGEVMSVRQRLILPGRVKPRFFHWLSMIVYRPMRQSTVILTAFVVI